MGKTSAQRSGLQVQPGLPGGGGYLPIEVSAASLMAETSLY